MPYTRTPNGDIRWVPEGTESPQLTPTVPPPQWQDAEYSELPAGAQSPANLGLYAGDPRRPYQPASEFDTPDQYDYQNQPDVLQLYQYLDRKRQDSLRRGDNEAAGEYEQIMQTFDPEEGIAKYGRRIPKYDQEYFISQTVGQHAREVRMKLEREEQAREQRFLKKRINVAVTNNSKLRKLFSEAIRKGFTSFKALKGNTQTAWGAELSRLAQNWPQEHAYEFSVAAEALFDQLAVHHAKGTIPEVAEDAERGKDVYRQKGYSDQEIAEVDDVSLITTGRDAREQSEAQQAEEQAAEEARVRESRRIAQTNTWGQRRVEQETELDLPTRKGHRDTDYDPDTIDRWVYDETEDEFNARRHNWRKRHEHKTIFLLQKMLRATQGRVPSISEIISNINSLRAADGLPPVPYEADDPQTQVLLQGLVDKAQQWNQEESQKGIEYRNIMLKAQQLAVQSEEQYRIFSLRTGGTEQQYKDEALRLKHEALDSLNAAEKDFDELLRPRLEGANRMDAVRNWEDVFGAARFNVHRTTYQENIEDLHYAKESPIGDTLEYWLPDKYKWDKGQGTDTPVFTNDPSLAASSNMMLKANAGKDLAAWYNRYWLPSEKDSPLARAIADIGLIPVSWAQAGGNMAVQGVGGLLQIAGVPGSDEFNRGFVKLNQRINAAYDKLHTDAFGEGLGEQLSLARSGIASLAAILGVNLVTGGAGGMATISAMFWGSSFAESYVEAKDQGKSGTEAYVYGNIMGFAEVAPMMLGAKWLKMPGMLKYLKGIGAVEGGALTNAAKTGLQSAIRRWAGYMSKDLLKSMGEESFQELLTLAIGRLAQGSMGIQTFENSMEGWFEQITDVLTATAWSMGFGQAMSSGGVFKRQQQQLKDARAAGNIVTKNIDPTTGRIKDDTNSLVSVASAVRDNLEAFTAFIAKPSRSNAEKLGIPLPKESNRQTLADEISPVVDFYTTEANNAEENAKRRDKGQEPLPNTANVTFEVDTGEKDSEGKPISRVVAIPVRVDPNTPAGEQQEAAEEKASQHDKIDGKPAKVIPKSDTHQKTTVTVQDEAGNEQDLTVYVPRSRITEGQTAEDIAIGDLESGVEIEGERFSPVGTKPVEETVTPRDPSPATRWVEPEESIEEIEAEAQAGTGQVDPEAPSTFTGAGVGKPIDQQIAEQEQQPEVEEDIEEDVERPTHPDLRSDSPQATTFQFEAMAADGTEISDVIEADTEEEATQRIRETGFFVTTISPRKSKDTPVEAGPTTPTQRQFKIVGPDQTGQERTITVWAEDENDAYAIGKDQGVVGTKIRKTKEKNTFQEEDLVEDDTQQEEQPAPEEQPSPMSANEQAVQDWINQEAELRGVPPEQIAGELGEDMDVATKGDTVEGAAAKIANNNREGTETDAIIDEQLDAVGKQEAPVEETIPEQTTTETTPTQEEAPVEETTPEEGDIPPQYDEQGFDKDGVTEDGRIRDPDYLDSDTNAPSISIEEAEQYLDGMPDDMPLRKARFNQRIEIAKQRQGKTAEATSETAPTQEATQEKAGPDSRTWTPEETQEKVNHAVGRINKRNKKRRKNARPTKVVEPTTEEGQRAVELADSLGVKLIFVDNMIGASGMAFESNGEMTGVIAVKKGKEGDALFQVVFHELAHGTGIDKIDLGLTKAEMDDLLHEYVSRGTKAQQADARQQFEDDPELARREAVATLMGRIATDPNFRAAYAKDNPTTFGKIVDAILEFFNLHPEAKLSNAQKNLLSELRKLHQKKTVEPAATFESSMESVLELSPEEVRQEAKKRKLPIGGQSTTAQREAIADDMHRESLADSVEMDPDIITERVQDNLKGKKLEDPGDFTADDFDVLEQIEDDSDTFRPRPEPFDGQALNLDPGRLEALDNKDRHEITIRLADSPDDTQGSEFRVQVLKAPHGALPGRTAQPGTADYHLVVTGYPNNMPSTEGQRQFLSDIANQMFNESGGRVNMKGVLPDFARQQVEDTAVQEGVPYEATESVTTNAEQHMIASGSYNSQAAAVAALNELSTSLESLTDRYIKSGVIDNVQAETWDGNKLSSEQSFQYTTPTEAAPKKKGRRRKRVKTTGQYVGAPKGIDTPSKLRTMLKKVENLVREGEYGRFWYERSSQQILDLVKGDKAEAEKLVMAIAITSSSTPVGMNFDFALQAYNQWKAGKPITTGRFPKAMGPKLQAAFEGTPWEGIKTNHFYTNLMRRIDPSKVQGVTHDIWMMRAFGFMGDSPTAAQYDFGLKEVQAIADKLGWEPQQVQAAAWVAMKARMENSDVKKATEAESVKKGFMTYVKNKEGKRERKVLNEEEHRKLWFKHANQHAVTEADKEGAKFDYKHASENILAQISHETKPGRATNHFPELFDAPYEQQVEFHHSMSQVFLDDSGADYPAKVFSILSPGDFEAPGFFEGTVSPGTQMLVVAPKGFKMDEQLDPSVEEAIRAYAAVRGILQKQDSVGYHRAFYNTRKRDQNGVEIQIGRPFTEAEIKQLADAIKEKVGHDEYNPISTPNGVRLIDFSGGRDVAADLAYEEQLKAEKGNPEAIKKLKSEKQRADKARGVANKEFRNIIEEVLSGIEMDGVDSAKVKAFAAVGGLVENNWEVNKNGEGYMANGFQGRPDLLGKARDIIGELHEKVQAVEDEFAQKYGWTKNEEIGIPQERTLEQVDNETADAARKTTEMHEKFLQKVRILIDGGMHMDEAIQQITDEYIEASVKAGIHRDVAASRAVKAMGAVRGALGRGASKNASTVNIGVENVPITVSSANSVLQQLLESHESETQLIHPDPHAQMSQFRDAITLVGDSVSQLLEHAEAISLSPAQAKIRLASKQQAIMTLAINYIQMELRADAKRLSRAKPGSPEARNIAARQVQNLETLERFVLGNQRLGTETARALQLRQGKNLFDNLDLDPIEVLAIATEMKGKPLTPEEKAEINKTVKDQKARAAQAKAAREKVDQAQAESTFNKEKKRPILGKDGKPKKVNTKANVAQIKKLLNEGC